MFGSSSVSAQTQGVDEISNAPDDKAVAQVTDEDYLPSDLWFEYTSSSHEIPLKWLAADEGWSGGSPRYWVRYKLAGTSTYYPVADAGRDTGYKFSDCSGDSSDTNCIPIESCKTFVVEVAQWSNDSNRQTVPTGTDQDWVHKYYNIPCGITNNSPKISAFTGSSSSFFEKSGCFTFSITLSGTANRTVSVELIRDDKEGTATPDEYSFSHSTVSWNSGQTGRKQVGCVRVEDDDIVERYERTMTFRLVHFNGIKDVGSFQLLDVRILDNDTTQVQISVSPSNAITTGIQESTSEITITASISNPLDTTCSIPWILNYAWTDEEALSRLQLTDFVSEVSTLGTFDFVLDGPRSTIKILTINNDSIPENAESLTLTTAGMRCGRTYEAGGYRGGTSSGVQPAISNDIQTVTIMVLPSDNPEIASVEAGDENGWDSDQKATVEWDLGTEVEANIDGYQVRWAEEVAGKADSYYQTDNSVVWNNMAVDSVTTRTQTIPDTGMLQADTSYVVQVGAITSVETEPIFAGPLGRVSTATPITATVSVTSSETNEGDSFEVSAELSAPLSEPISLSVELREDSSDTSAESDDYETGAKSFRFEAGETTATMLSFQTMTDTDNDDETLQLAISAASEILLSTQTIPLTIVEPSIVTNLSVSAGDGNQILSDIDRSFSAAWTPPEDIEVSSFMVGWVRKPSDGSIPPDDMWTTDSVDGSTGVFPDGSLLYRASSQGAVGGVSGQGLDAETEYLVRVRPVAEGEFVDWSDPVEVTTGPPITVSYSVVSDRVDEGGSVSLNVSLSEPLSEDIMVTWGYAFGDTPGAGGLGLTAEEGDVGIVGAETSVLSAGSTSLVRVYRTEVDDDGDDEVFSPFVSFDGDIVQPERLLITIADTGSGGQGVVPGGGPVGPTVTVLGGGGGQFPVGGVPSGGGSNSGGVGVIPVTSPPVTSGGGVPGGSPPVTSVGGVPGGGPVGGGTLPVGQSLPVDQARATGSGFLDTVGTTHEVNIDRLAESGITRGCNPPANSLFCPDRAVTRGEMATFMVRSFDLDSSGSDLFGDDDGNTHEANINALASAEITRGCNPPVNSRYCPDRPVTRAQMATFLARAMGLVDGSGDFTDTGGSPHADDINRIASVGITRGCNPPANSRFCPDRPVTRGEMATFLIRAEEIGSS